MAGCVAAADRIGGTPAMRTGGVRSKPAALGLGVSPAPDRWGWNQTPASRINIDRMAARRMELPRPSAAKRVLARCRGRNNLVFDACDNPTRVGPEATGSGLVSTCPGRSVGYGRRGAFVRGPALSRISPRIAGPRTLFVVVGTLWVSEINAWVLREIGPSPHELGKNRRRGAGAPFVAGGREVVICALTIT